MREVNGSNDRDYRPAGRPPVRVTLEINDPVLARECLWSSVSVAASPLAVPGTGRTASARPTIQSYEAARRRSRSTFNGREGAP